MAWLRFTADHDHRTGSSTIAYKAGHRCHVTRDCHKEALELGRAEAIRAPSKAHAKLLKLNPSWVEVADGTDGGG